MSPTPTIGRIVHFELSEHDVALIQHQRGRIEASGQPMPGLNMPSAGDVYPALIVRAWSSPEGPLVNLQVFLDGLATMWATSRKERTDEETAGRWFWPPRV